MIWASRIPGRGSLRAEYLISGFTWLVFALLILGRVTAGWRGRRAAWLTLLGFLATFAVLLLYVGRRAVG